MVYYRDTGVNALAWGNGGSEGRAQRRQTALRLNIITENQRLTQRRITDWLNRQGPDHPDRQIFENYVGVQPHLE